MPRKEAIRVRRRAHPQQVYCDLKLATRRLVEELGGVEPAASLTRVGKTMLASYYDPSSALYIPVDVVADLEVDSASMPVTTALARLRHAVVHITLVADLSPDLPSKLGEVAEEIGDVFQKAGRAVAQSGRIDPDLARECREAIYEASKCLLELDDLILQQASSRAWQRHE
jgi:hypothetical protein